MLLRGVINPLIYLILIDDATASTSFQIAGLYSSNRIEDSIFYEITKRIYPDTYSEVFMPQQLDFNNVLIHEPLAANEVDLSNMGLERIPLILASRMRSIEKLDLSFNPNLRLHEEWFGEFSQNLKEVSLSKCNLKRRDLEAIARLKHLESLNISNNTELEIGSMDGISLWANLKHLDISHCDLKMSDLNRILKHAMNLESLKFSGNDLGTFDDEIEIPEHLRKTIKILDLSSCKLESNALEHIFRLSSLEMIDLSDNDFSKLSRETTSKIFNSPENILSKELLYHGKRKYEMGKRDDGQPNIDAVPSKIAKKDTQGNSTMVEYESQLRTVKLSNCQINSKDFITKIFDLDKLEVLILTDNNLKFSFNKDAKSKKSLRVLKVNNCSISGIESLYHLTDFAVLEELDMKENMFPDVPMGFSLGCSKKSLKQLDAQWCNLNYNGLKAITDCKRLERLNGSFNRFGSIPQGFRLGISRDSLKEVRMHDCSMNWNGLKAISDCSQLGLLEAAYNDFGNIPEGFSLGCSITSLKEIDLSDSKLNFYGFRAITDCPNLEKICISNNLIYNVPLRFELGRSKNSLKTIIICNSCVNYHGLAALTDCPMLEKLDVSFNVFEDIPMGFRFGSSRFSLKELNVANCRLGDILASLLSNCEKLEHMNTCGNEANRMEIGESEQYLTPRTLGRFE